ncbi:AAA family ATPase [Kaistia dalseonensis]|uniref:Chromosome segregation ATPase n=1 Tax=Kaistia dalseonensis TaxID=410840 RepID=A0ABU0HAV0_9HYPH|nr:AAA family ATPase [Kaistia dalseonensis]MCX5496277.1 AAA family ATPase [Kaistia dalseonensis]MDQ0438895.1 chromosome segregation ATPase [Kaistia dalseonensis]
MKLRRIEVRDFRKLGHVVIADLADGLNVVVGDNEAGKSTLLAALRAVLFERHRVGGNVAASMQPYGQTVRPQVWLEFERDGVSWKLHKAFCQKQEAELEGGGGRWTGDAVEERLAEMFGFTPPGRGESKPDEHHGVFGLLWVEQGTSHQALGVGAGRDHLAAALEREVGQVTGGERGRLLLAAAEARKAAFWDKRNNPRDAFKALAVDLEAAREQRTTIQQQLAAYESKVARLATLQEILNRHRRDDSLRVAEARLVAAQKAAAVVAQYQGALRTAEIALEGARLRHEAAVGRLAAREKARTELERTKRDFDAAGANLAEAQGQLARLELAAGIADSRSRAAESAVREADSVVQRIEQAAVRRQARETAARLAQQLAAAEAADQARLRAEAIIVAAALTPQDLKQLEGLERAADQARLRLEAASARVTLLPEGEHVVQIEGSDDLVEPELVLSRDTTLVLQGYGRIHIQPGGGIGELVRASDEAHQALVRALQRLGQTDLTVARLALQRIADARSEERIHTQALSGLAPKGLDALRQELARSLLLAGTGDTEDAAGLGDVDAARSKAAEARRLFETLAAEAAQANVALEAVRRDIAILAERARVAAHAHQRLRDELGAAREAAPDQALEGDALTCRLARTEAEANWATARDAVAAADPEATTLAVERAIQAEKAIREDIDRTERERRDLDVELRALGKDGLGEELETLNGRIELLEARLKTTTLEAEAARLLADTLAEAQRETKEKWLAPVRERSAPYLRLIQNESSIVLSEGSFEIERLVRNGVSEPFAGLSVGAREQIAVITRLALADILREGGQESCIVLDDALVNTDEGRLERMHLVLHKAAQRQQILILTCRERDFLQLGAPIRRI